MDWDDLRVFLAVARSSQFVAAGRLLGLDHATVGRRVTALERDLKAKLFVRRTTGVALTAAGERLLQSAERIESDVLRVRSELTDKDFELSGTVRIGAPDGFSTYYLARCFADFAARHPAITVQLVPTPQVIPLSRRETDILVALQKPDSGRYVTRKLTDYSLGIFADRAYLDRYGTPLDLAALRQHRLIGYVEDYAYSSALDYVRTLFDDTPTSFQCTSAIGQLEAIRSGLGIGIVHDFIAGQHLDLVRLLPERRAQRSYWIVEHEDVRGLGRVRTVHDHIVASVEAEKAIFQPVVSG
ncbi:LysR family transcriptional regulator [Lichenihabitans sp. PAMC28606]|uniref:LysR family transcriptional regulator n=1 Tax=Lichenihabitans sp. PAMC28606 TaxID=2880932 RepID=UPI001D0AD589|nr:LysR family transcriptional regulator [Lichenihabitans sp. PAMC28606]UDL94322.1 LysR family transcriptional regulator [Lichenihabitans sp. PAMC28606]